MTGEEVPKDKPDENKVPNLRLRFLEEVQKVADEKFTEAGVLDDGLCHADGVAKYFMSSDGWVNAPDTWTCKLADSHNDIVRSNVSAVIAASTYLQRTVDSEIDSIFSDKRDEVPEDDEDATWKPN